MRGSMARSIDRTAAATIIALITCSIGAGCAAPLKASTPKGLAFDCEPGGLALVHFGDGGYLPEASVRATRGGETVQVPRSTARLVYGGAHLALVAEWAEQGLRYRSEEPVDGAYLVWTQRGEEAELGRRTALIADADGNPEGERVALCRRSGRSGDVAQEGEAPHRP